MARRDRRTWHSWPFQETICSKQQNLYKILKLSLLHYEEIISIPLFPVDEINKVIKALLTDTPELFWFEGKWFLENEQGKMVVIPCYTIDKYSLQDAKQKLEDISKCICHNTNYRCNGSEYDKAKFIFDWIYKNVQYGTYISKGQTVYDALIHRKAVCKGISKSYQYLLKKMNVFSTLQEGSLDGISKHVWNIVEIDRRYYNVDICMAFSNFSYLYEEKNQGNQYRCFMVSNQNINRTHKIYCMPWPQIDCALEFEEANNES